MHVFEEICVSTAEIHKIVSFFRACYTAFVAWESCFISILLVRPSERTSQISTCNKQLVSGRPADTPPNSNQIIVFFLVPFLQCQTFYLFLALFATAKRIDINTNLDRIHQMMRFMSSECMTLTFAYDGRISKWRLRGERFLLKIRKTALTEPL